MSRRHINHHEPLEAYLVICGVIGEYAFKALWLLLVGIYRLVRAGVRKLQERHARKALAAQQGSSRALQAAGRHRSAR